MWNFSLQKDRVDRHTNREFLNFWDETVSLELKHKLYSLRDVHLQRKITDDIRCVVYGTEFIGSSRTMYLS